MGDYRCSCGNVVPMKDMTYRVVQHEQQYTIENIPMYVCSVCGNVNISRINRIKIKKIIEKMNKTTIYLSDFQKDS